VYRSSKVTRSVSEGLLCQTFWVLSARKKISVVSKATVAWRKWVSVLGGRACSGCGTPGGGDQCCGWPTFRRGRLHQVWPFPMGECLRHRGMRDVPLSAWSGGGVLEWVFRRGRGVGPDPKVQVRFPTVVVEVVGLLGRGGSGGRMYR
jgi:hypothetical protein